MAAHPPGTLCNSVFNAFPTDVRDRLTDRLLTKPIHSGEILHEPGAPLIHLVFPHSGLISLQTILQDGRTVEKRSVGRDSFLGVEYFLGEKLFRCHAVVAVTGLASLLSVSDMETALTRFNVANDVIRNHTFKLFENLHRAIVCASVHSASQRLATWLLRAQDRSDGHQLELTQRTLAGIFGLRLATISDACGRFHDAGAIVQARGILTIIDRSKLEAQACECYRF